jgi:hypothetical protein
MREIQNTVIVIVVFSFSPNAPGPFRDIGLPVSFKVYGYAVKIVSGAPGIMSGYAR